MKKLISLMLVAVVMLTSAGCAKKDEDKGDSSKSVAYSIDIVDLASKGEISELEFKLGNDVEELKQKYKTEFEADQTKPELQENEGPQTVQLNAGNNIYYYEKAKKANGISVIACTESIYDFAIGGVTLMEDIKAAIAKQPAEGTATADDLFFLPAVPENCKMLTYEMGTYILKMFFVDGFLTAAVLYDPENWSI